MLEMVQTESAASSVTDHRGNIAVAGGGESASVISQHNNRRWRLFQVSIGERMEGRRLLGVMPLNSVQLQAIPLGILTPGTTNDFISIWDFLFPSGQSIWLMLSINILLKCDKANESFNCCGTGWESLAYIYFQQSKCDNWFFCFTHTQMKYLMCMVSFNQDGVQFNITSMNSKLRNVWKLYFFWRFGSNFVAIVGLWKKSKHFPPIKLWHGHDSFLV